MRKICLHMAWLCFAMTLWCVFFGVRAFWGIVSGENEHFWLNVASLCFNIFMTIWFYRRQKSWKKEMKDWHD